MTQKTVASINARVSKTNNNPFWIVGFNDGTSALCWEEALIMGVNPGDTVEVSIETHSSGGKQTNKITSMSVVKTTKADVEATVPEIPKATAPEAPKAPETAKAPQSSTQQKQNKKEGEEEEPLPEKLQAWVDEAEKKIRQMQAPKTCTQEEFNKWKDTAWKKVCDLGLPKDVDKGLLQRVARDVMRIWTSHVDKQSENRTTLKTYVECKNVPPEYLKIIGGGKLNGFSNINTMWRIKKLTEMFGEVGKGWKVETVYTETTNGPKEEIAVFTKVNLFVKYEGSDSWSEPIEGYGGSRLVAREKSGLYFDDEAYKKAYSDAIGSACKMIGIGAEIYLGIDDTKYARGEELG